MDSKRFLVAAIAAFVVTMVLGYLWHAVVMVETYAAASVEVARPEAEVDMTMIVLGQAVLALIMAYMFPIGSKGGPPVSEGFRFGALIGVLWTLPLQLIFVGIWQIGLQIALIDSAWHIVEQGLAGIAIAYAYKS